MIKLSRLADYGVALLTRMAENTDRVHNALDLSVSTGLPTPTVSKVLATLARNGLLLSVRGAKGGYRLGRPPQGISVADIIIAIDGPIALTQCLEHSGGCDVEALCPSRRGWELINVAVSQALEKVSLADIESPMAMFPAIDNQDKAPRDQA